MPDATPKLEAVKPAPKRLTKDEMAVTREKLLHIIPAFGTGLNTGISLTNKKRRQCTIWTFTDSEIASITERIIVSMQMSNEVLQTVRATIYIYDTFGVGALLTSKLGSTFIFYLLSGGLHIPSGVEIMQLLLKQEPDTHE